MKWTPSAMRTASPTCEVPIFPPSFVVIHQLGHGCRYNTAVLLWF